MAFGVASRGFAGFQGSLLLRQVKAWVERLKRPPAENAKILYNDTDGSKGFQKDMIRHISLKYSCSFGKFIPSIMWHSLDHDITKPVFSNGARMLNFSLKILIIKLSAKLSGWSISLARWIKALHAGLFHYFQSMGKTRFVAMSSLNVNRNLHKLVYKKIEKYSTEIDDVCPRLAQVFIRLICNRVCNLDTCLT